MKIVERHGVEGSVLPGRVGTGVRCAGRTATAVRGPDTVRVSDVARALGELIAAGVAEDAPDPARAAQVAILRNAVASGRYQPDLQDVARKLLSEVAAELPS